MPKTVNAFFCFGKGWRQLLPVPNLVRKNGCWPKNPLDMIDFICMCIYIYIYIYVWSPTQLWKKILIVECLLLTVISYSCNLQQNGKKLIGAMCKSLTGFYNSPFLHFLGKTGKTRFGLSIILCHRHNYRNKKTSLSNAWLLTAAGSSIIGYSCKKWEKHLFCSHRQNYRNCNYRSFLPWQWENTRAPIILTCSFSFGGCPVFTQTFYHFLFSIILSVTVQSLNSRALDYHRYNL